MALLASSRTRQGIEDCIKRFYCGERKVLSHRDGTRFEYAVVTPTTGNVLTGVRVVVLRGRWRFESVVCRLMARADDFHPDPLDVLADYHDLPRDQFWATYPSLRAVVSLGSFGEAGELLKYLGGVVVERRRAPR